ncbi:hypothetical protein Tco_0431600 [Tanacetum coccineum]
MKAIQEDVKAKKISFKTDKDIVREEEADRLRKENEEFRKAVQSQQLKWQKFVNHFNAHQTGTSSQYPVPNLYTPQAFSSPNYIPPNFDGYRPIFEHRSTSQIVRDAYLDGDHLDVDGDNTGDGDGSDSLDGDSGDDSNDACDEDYQNQRDLPKDTSIDRLEVLEYDIGKRSKVRMGIIPTKTELTLEQTQQVTMEILLEPTSNKLLVGDVGDSIWITHDTEDQSCSRTASAAAKPYQGDSSELYLITGNIKSTIQIHDHRLTKGTVKNSQDNKAPRREVMPTMPNTRSGASRIREGVNKQINHRLAGALRPCGAARNREPLIRDEGKLEEVSGNRENRNGGNRNGGIRNRGNRNGWNRNGGNGNGGTGNGNGNKGGYGYNFEGYMPARECTYQDFLKFQPLNFNGTEGVVGLTRWFEKMETIFNISNCPKKYQVKYATCTLLNSALTWWNSHKRMIGIEAAYAMSWTKLMNLITEVYYPRNKVQKMEIKLWNLAVKGNDLTAYTIRF